MYNNSIVLNGNPPAHTVSVYHCGAAAALGQGAYRLYNRAAAAQYIKSVSYFFPAAHFKHIKGHGLPFHPVHKIHITWIVCFCQGKELLLVNGQFAMFISRLPGVFLSQMLSAPRMRRSMFLRPQGCLSHIPDYSFSYTPACNYQIG